jgi:Lon protease-like protein
MIDRVEIRVPERMPVFPLPRVVFFPGTVLPLHVFEPRYRALVSHAARGDRVLAVSLLQPGWEEDYQGSPAFHRVATAGRVEGLRKLPDGRFLLHLVGFARVALGEVMQERPFRIVRAEGLPESGVDEESAEIGDAKRVLLASHGSLVRLLSGQEEGFHLDESVPFEQVLNQVCASLPVEPEIRQALLEEDDLIERHRAASERLDRALEEAFRQRSDDPEGGASPPN